MTSRWQQAWDDAEHRLQEWKRSWSSSSIKPRVLRVNQLDAELLDEELVQILLEPLAKALGLVNGALRSRLEPELSLFLRLLLYKFSMWDFGATYGAKLQGLRCRCTNTMAEKLAPSGLPRKTLAAHLSLTVLASYVHGRLRSYALSNAWPDTPSSDARRRAWNLMSTLESMHSAAALLNFILFLWNGRYRTLADRLLSMRLVPSRSLVNRQISYEFMNRQMVWHAFTEFLLLFLPVFGSRAFRRTYNQIASRIRNSSWNSVLSKPTPSSPGSSQTSLRKGPFFSLPENQCAICTSRAPFGLSSLATGGISVETGPWSAYLESAVSRLSGSSAQPEDSEKAIDAPPEYPVTTPYRASCGHVYCYVCLSDVLLRAIDDGEDGWTCLRCLEAVRSCVRLTAIYDGESAASEGWQSDVDDLTSFESDAEMSLDSDYFVPDRSL